MIERSEPCKACDLFARKGPDLWHTDEDGQCRALSNALDSLDERQTVGEVFVGAQGPDKCPDLSAAELLEPGDLGGDESPLAILTEGLGTGLGPGKIVLDLFEPGKLLGEGYKPRVM